MLISVPISSELATEMLTEGYTVRATTSITKGLPPGAKLIGVTFAGSPQMLVLVFEVPGEGLARDISIEVRVDREGHELAHKLALDNSQVSIECNSINEEREDGAWLRLLDEDVVDLADELRYLELRGLLLRRPGEPELLRVDNDPEGTCPP
jgi:hypothetical protein